MITDTSIKPRKNGTKEEKKAYYKAQQIKLNAKLEAARAKDRYDLASNPLNLNAELLGFEFEFEMRMLCGDIPSRYKVGELLAADGQVSQRFWSLWKGEDDAYGLMRGPMSFKAQVVEAGVRPVKLSDGRWTLAVNGTPILN